MRPFLSRPALVRPFIGLSLAILVHAPALAQSPQAPSAADRSMAAGYRALTLCSALKLADRNGAARTVASIDAHELSGVYAELDPLVRDMPTEIAETEVRVTWDPAMPARVALHTPGRGCAIMPVGYQGGAERAPLPRRAVAPPLPTARATGDAAGLDAALTAAMTGAYGQGGRTTALVVMQNGRLVAERYADGFGPDTPQRTWSVAKSLAVTLVGAAVMRGQADVNAPTGLADWSTPGDPRAAITIDQLVRMSSGLTSDTAGNRTDGLYFGGVTMAEQITTWPLIASPGTRYRYANNDTLLAVTAIADSFESESPNAFLDRIGMTGATAETDWMGGYVLSSQVWATARDLARLGQLYADDGVIGGQRVLPQGWRDYVSRLSGPQLTGANYGYGAGFRIYNQAPGVPADTLAAVGNRGQYVVIVPGRNIVLVRRGEDPAGTPFDAPAWTRDVLAALD